MSGRPQRRSVSASAASQASRVAVSTVTASASPAPAPASARTRSAAALIGWLVPRPQRQTVDPARAKATARLAGMPPAPPVITVIFPARENIDSM